MKRWFFYASAFFLLSSCTYSQNMINAEGHVISCGSYGWGIIGGPMAINILNECIKSHKQMGYIEFEKVGVPGFYLSEGNPPSITKVQTGLPAEKAGMLAGDKIISVNGQKVNCRNDVYVLGFCKPGEVINYEVLRGSELKSFSLIAAPKARKAE